MRKDYVMVRVTEAEKQLIAALAEHEERTVADMMRRLVREKAASVGIRAAA